MDKQTIERRRENFRLLRSCRTFLALLICPFFLSGCQLTYLASSGYHQAQLLYQRVPIEKALRDERLTEQQKRKLLLAQEARLFAETDLGLRPTKNYTSYVHLDRPYVTWVVTAAERNQLKAHNWNYPLVGSLPYKGFFNEKAAKEEAERMNAQGYDTYVRGVSAYSTLGWFKDPILSSMLRYKDYDLVDTIIHETVHATIYIKSEADFNERLAVFFGEKGAEAFFRKREGDQGPTLLEMADDKHDDKLFSDFMAKEIKELEAWYEERKDLTYSEDERKSRLALIKERFKSALKPLLKRPDSYRNFESAELNNARLINFKLYFENLDDFEAVFAKLGHDYRKMLDYCKRLEKSKDPKADLAKAASSLEPLR